LSHDDVREKVKIVPTLFEKKASSHLRLQGKDARTILGK